MTTKARRQRELAERESLFLRTAWGLIRRDGLLKLQMTRLAAECEYAVGTLYQHFDSKEDLLVALAVDCAQTRLELLQRVAAWRAPTRERFFALAVAESCLARNAPEHFRLSQYATTEVVWAAASAARREATIAACAPIKATVESLVADGIAAGDLDPVELPPLAFGVGAWALCVGMHTLVHAEGVLDFPHRGEPYRLLLVHMQHLLNGMQWRPLADPADAGALDRLLARILEQVFPEFATLADRPGTPAPLLAVRTG